MVFIVPGTHDTVILVSRNVYVAVGGYVNLQTLVVDHHWSSSGTRSLGQQYQFLHWLRDFQDNYLQAPILVQLERWLPSIEITWFNF